MKKLLPAVLFPAALLIVPHAFSNGGGYDTGVASTGNVFPHKLKGVDGVRIIDEQLDIRLREEDAHVTVRYQMENASGAPAVVTFGFPIEAIQIEPIYIYPRTDQTPKLQSFEKSIQHLKDYEVTVGGEPLTIEFDEIDASRSEPPEMEGLAGWLVSTATFPAASRTEMKITYSVDYEIHGTFISDDSRYDEAMFCYRLSSGAVWKDSIRRGRVTITPDGCEPEFVEVRNPAGRFARTEKDAPWVWEFENLEPTLADDIIVRALPPTRTYRTRGSEGNSHEFINIGERWQYRNTMSYGVTATSTLPDDGDLSYSANNVTRGRWDEDEEAWTEGAAGDGIGEGLDITPDKALPLDAILIRPGYSKSPELYIANGRPREISISLNGGAHRFTHELDDRDTFQQILIEGYDTPVKSIELRINSVYRGTQHDDTCIAAVHLISRLTEKPERYGAR